MNSLFLLSGIAAPVSIVGWQTYTWLRFGFWPALPLITAVEGVGQQMPHVEWAGLQKIIEGLFEAPLSLVLFCTAALVFWLVEIAKSASDR